MGLPIDIARKFDTSNFHEICDILTNGPGKIEQNVKISVNERENQAEAEKKQQESKNNPAQEPKSTVIAGSQNAKPPESNKKRDWKKRDEKGSIQVIAM